MRQDSGLLLAEVPWPGKQHTVDRNRSFLLQTSDADVFPPSAQTYTPRQTCFPAQVRDCIEDNTGFPRGIPVTALKRRCSGGRSVGKYVERFTSIEGAPFPRGH